MGCEVETSVHAAALVGWLRARSDPIARQRGKREGREEATYPNEALHEKITISSYETQESTCSLVCRNEREGGRERER